MSDTTIDPRAAAILKPRLDDGETLVWAQRPDFARMTIYSIRDFFLHPLHLAGMASLVIGFAWTRLAPPPLEFALISAAVVLGIAGPLIFDALACPLVILPFFTPTAYGATRSYLLITRGLLFPRLVRAPVSLLQDITLTRWAGRDAIVFKTEKKHSPSFSFLHASDPAGALQELRSAIALDQRTGAQHG
ncbi:MAG TPA: hypothetical protein VGO52_24125 [Hyphomonadaceae bacterium]|jgi:hypothetical protein|nr:hypothetical protein [Hyphomonadaceae bacterium]